jgi:hypothetical protein
MDTEHFSRFFPTACAGFGLLLAGGANLMLLRRGFVVRAVATALALGIGLGAASALDQPDVVTGTARILGIALVPCLLLGCRPLVAGFAGLISTLSRPAVRFGLLTIVGVGTVVGAIVYEDIQDEKAGEDQLAELEFLHARADSTPSQKSKATTDLGTAIVLKEPTTIRDGPDLTTAEEKILRGAHNNDQVIRRGAASDHSNCHGWVFAGGRFILSPDDVELILRENGYTEVQEPHAGDLVIYRRDNAIVHSAIIRYVTEGQPVLVEGKWGVLGVFLHPADASVYGNDYTFYRSHRSGHLLAGIGGTPVSGQPVVHSTATE